jgi:hypothetical protein
MGSELAPVLVDGRDVLHLAGGAEAEFVVSAVGKASFGQEGQDES